MLTACVTIAPSGLATPTPLFVTSTLPPTKAPLTTPVALPPGDTAPTLSATEAPNCKDQAILVQDVTIPDGTNIARGAKFTKTWQFQNTGTCIWTGYSIAFVSGDPMSAPDSVPVPQTAPKSTVDVSVDLAAPTADGRYTGFFELRNAKSQPINIGAEKTFWVEITVGVVRTPTAGPVGTPSGGTPATPPKGPVSCKYVGSPSYPGEIAKLINQARAQNGLPALTVNTQLAAAAQGHSIDMACFSLLSHTGTNGSTPYQRVTASGYDGTFRQEIIFASGYPQDAFNWWMNDPIHRDAILDPKATEIGAGYAYVSDSTYGGYYTVEFGSR